MKSTIFLFAASLAMALGAPMGAEAETKPKEAPKEKAVPRTEPGCIRACAGGRMAADGTETGGTETGAPNASDPAEPWHRVWTKTTQTTGNGGLCKWVSNDTPPKAVWQSCGSGAPG